MQKEFLKPGDSNSWSKQSNNLEKNKNNIYSNYSETSGPKEAPARPLSKKLLREDQTFRLKFLKNAGPGWIYIQHPNGFRHTIRREACLKITQELALATGREINQAKEQALIWYQKVKAEMSRDDRGIEQTRQLIAKQKAHAEKVRAEPLRPRGFVREMMRQQKLRKARIA